MHLKKKQLFSLLIIGALVGITIGGLSFRNRQRKLSDYLNMPNKEIKNARVFLEKDAEITKEKVYLLWNELKEIKAQYRYENAKNPNKTIGSCFFDVYFTDNTSLFVSNIKCIYMPIGACHKYQMNSEELQKFKNVLRKYIE